jgi:FixJ family two-component response regulator
MPGMTGIELIARVRQSHPDVVRMLLTGGASLDSALRAINEGEVHRYLTKPWDKAEMRETIRQALDRLDELRNAAAAARAVVARNHMLSELERAHPGIRNINRSHDEYLLDIERLRQIVSNISSPAIRLFFGG